MSIRGQQSTGDLLRESWECALANGGDIALHMYAEIPDLGPEIQDIFVRVNLEEQRELFMGTLQFIVMNYERRALVERMLREMGRRHVGYGVRPEHYGVFGECFLRALKRSCGSKWNLETELLWRTVYEDIADVMAQGASEAA
jgi:hemoglobin-like flavoprotein